MWYLVLFSVAFAVVDGQTTLVDRCIVNEGDLPIHTYIDGCTQMPCLLYQQENSFVNMIFRAPRTMISMRTLATAFLSLGPVVVPVPYPLGDDAVTCNFLTNSFCPVLAGEVLMYTLTMFIEDFMVAGTIANLEFRIVDENNVPVTCIRVAIHIQAPRQITHQKTPKMLGLLSPKLSHN